MDSASSNMAQTEKMRTEEPVITWGYGALLIGALLCFIGGSHSLLQVLPNFQEQGLTFDALYGTQMLLLFLVSAFMAIPTTIMLLLRCIWSTREVSFFTYMVILVGGILSYVYLVFLMNFISRFMANSLFTVFS